MRNTFFHKKQFCKKYGVQISSNLRNIMHVQSQHAKTHEKVVKYVQSQQ